MDEAELAQMAALVAKHETTLYGPMGTNGLYSTVREMNRKLDTYIEVERKRREEDALRHQRDRLERQKDRRRNLLTILSLVLVVVVALLPYLLGPA